MAKKDKEQNMDKSEKPKSDGKPSVSIGIKGDPKSFSVSDRGLAKFASGVDKEKPEVEAEVSPAIVINRLPHPMTLSYGGEAMVVPPRGKVKIANIEKLGGLPKGMQLLPVKN